MISTSISRTPALRRTQFREIEKIKNEIASLTATSYAVDAHIMKFDPEDEASYDKVIAELDSLVGKKIYKLRNGKYIDETDASYTPDGSEEVTVYDEGYLCFFKYSTAFTMEKDNDVLTAFLCETVEKSPSLAPVVTPLLARTYVLGGQYDKAQELADKQKSINTEGADYYIISSMISRYRDGDFQKSAALCDEGLNMISSLPGGDMLIQRFGYKLSFHKALALIMLQENSDAKNYSDAYKIVDGCQRLLTEGQRQVEIQIRDLYAMLALATGDDEAYENLESMIENYPDDSVPFSEDVKDYKDGKKTLAEIVSSGRYDLL